MIEFIVGIGIGFVAGAIVVAVGFVWIITTKKNALLMTLAGVKAKHAEREEEKKS